MNAKSQGANAADFSHGEMQCDAISALCRERLPGLLQTVLDAAAAGAEDSSQEERRLCLDRVVVDLGAVRRGEWPKVLAERLPRAVMEQAAFSALTASSGETAREARLADILVHYLSHGVFPWNGATVSTEEWRDFLHAFSGLPGRVQNTVREAACGGVVAQRRLTAMYAGLGVGAVPPELEAGSQNRQLEPEDRARSFFTEPQECRVHIHNAGLVLATPFLPMYFKRLELVNDTGFTGSAAREKAVLALELLADTRAEHHTEGTLALNKLLCGLRVDEPLEPWPAVGEREREEAGKLLEAMIGHWAALGRTSPAALADTFLLRPGILSTKGIFTLHVERRPQDVLLDRLPWVLSIIQTPWMENPIQVVWNE